ncbi:hypothetical protein LG197_23120 [Pseudomonas asiatica]|uniref:hypothetical protein n=1 Tax=Pseudomonas asiatica TaxID=2219225 RepID=UPI002367A584|nr:hypothetical protein [Pseudomonas asiatica]WDM87476.1 hypothetical protein LG197_23120 [Pseudomonas asiatica]
MDTNKMREQFEAAFIEKCAADLSRKVPGITRETAIKFIRCNWLARSGDDYELPVPNGAWWGWQASRAAVVVELPSAIESPPYACFQSGWNDMRGEAVDAIEAQGLKVEVKP